MDNNKLIHNHNVDYYVGAAADVAFSDINNGILSPVESMEFTRPMICGSSTIFSYTVDYYLTERKPIKPLGEQLLKYGCPTEVQIEKYSNVFYIIGTSPYDFIRCFKAIPPLVPSAITEKMVGSLLGSSFIMYNALNKWRDINPESRHHFIGMPLMGHPHSIEGIDPYDSAIYNRSIVSSFVKKTIFDTVYMPAPEILDGTLLYTRNEYCIDGRTESREYVDAGNVNGTDFKHMNSRYAKFIIESYINPLIQEQ
jgi:hypothetical protein